MSLLKQSNLNINNLNANRKIGDYTFFFRYKSPFSNFHPAVFKYKGITFISNEQFFVFCKAKLFNDEVVAKKVMDINNTEICQKLLLNQINPKDIIKDDFLGEEWNKQMIKVKRYGKAVKNYDDAIWIQKRQNIMFVGVREKFKQNNNLAKILLDTKNTYICEASPYDNVWGIGLKEDEARKLSSDKWPGINLLGKVLESVRELLKNEINETKDTIKEKQFNIEILNFYHIGKTIPEDGIYIGRENKKLGLKGSIFANPFPMKNNSPEERERVIKEYDVWLWKQIKDGNIKKDDLLKLNNKKLVCYCHPKPCHGDSLINAVKLLIEQGNDFDKKCYILSVKPKTHLLK